MRTLYFDCYAGISGDMTLGALIDLGVDFETLKTELSKLSLPGYQLRIERVLRAHVSGTKFHVDLEPSVASEHTHNHSHSHDHDHKHTHDHHSHSHTHDHDHEHSHHDHPHTHSHTHDHQTQADSNVHEHSDHSHSHRGLPEISAIIAASTLSPWVKTQAQKIFARLAEAEGKVHGIPPEKVHFHEVGAVDAIVDIVGACIGFELLGVEQFISAPLHVGKGRVNCAHGNFPVPAPGTLAMLTGIPIYSQDIEGELVTPTGAAIISTLCTQFMPLPPMRIEKVGYGAGSREIKDFPNLLRLYYGELTTKSTMAVSSESIMVIEANLDDMNPQIYGYLMDRMLAQGAVDIFYTPIYMKKNRPGILLTVLTDAIHIEKIVSLLFRETTTIGLRYYETSRRVLARQHVNVQTDFGTIRVKVARNDDEIINIMPEYEDCCRIAQASDIPLASVQAAAIKAFEREYNNKV